ncbi:hypothetical protein V6N11_005435 [Hibiscus sabdariffa]|uniref:Uncharacterized protein n=1 Tax=Hibiscus sabdariffa TaxID=183260 RepID=A0ABR2RNK3_9ROSI
MQVVVSRTLQAIDRVTLLVMAELYDSLQQAWEGGYQQVLLECETMTTIKLLVDEAGENRDLGVHATVHYTMLRAAASFLQKSWDFLVQN